MRGCKQVQGRRGVDDDHRGCARWEVQPRDALAACAACSVAGGTSVGAGMFMVVWVTSVEKGVECVVDKTAIYIGRS